MPKSDVTLKAMSEASDSRRAELRTLCAPAYHNPTPAGVNVFGWIMVVFGALGVLACFVLLAVGIVQLFTQSSLAGERLFAGAVWLGFAAFFTYIWHSFRNAPDWRVAPDVPLSVKVFGEGGSAVAASCAAAALTLLVFAVCSKTMFLRLMDSVGAGDVGKVQVILSSLAAAFYFLLLWYLFRGLIELRETARTALVLIFAVTAAAAILAALLDATGLAPLLVNSGGRVLCYKIGALAIIGLVLDIMLVGPRAVQLFRANEP